MVKGKREKIYLYSFEILLAISLLFPKILGLEQIVLGSLKIILFLRFSIWVGGGGKDMFYLLLHQQLFEDKDYSININTYSIIHS